MSDTLGESLLKMTTDNLAADGNGNGNGTEDPGCSPCASPATPTRTNATPSAGNSPSSPTNNGSSAFKLVSPRKSDGEIWRNE